MRRGVVRIRLTCPATCRFTATISRGKRKLGRAAGRGRAVTLRVHLSARGRRLVRARKRVTVRVTRRLGTQKAQVATRTLRVRAA
jgi:hypothetical protein